MIEMKRCTGCGEEKAKEFFGRRKTTLKSTCKACEAEWVRQKRAVNPEEARRKSREYCSKNKSLLSIYRKRYYYSKTPIPLPEGQQRQCATCGGVYPATPDYFIARKRGARWLTSDCRNCIQAKGITNRAKRLAVEGKVTPQDLSKKFREQGGQCFYCRKNVGRRVAPWHADHFIPLSKGGTNHPSNIVITCPQCNLSKHAKFPWEFMPDRFSPPAAAAD